MPKLANIKNTSNIDGLQVMGVIQRQGGKEAIIRFGSIVLGFVNTYFIYLYFLDPDELGLLRFLQSTASLFVPFVMLGMVSIINRYFTYFRSEEKGHSGFLFFALVVPTIGFVLFLIISLIFQEDIRQYYAAQDVLFGRYIHFVIPICLFELYRQVLTNYSGVNFRIVFPSLVNEIGIKVGIPILVIAYYLGWLTLDGLVSSLALVYAFILLGVLWYVRHLGQLYLRPNPSIFRHEKMKEIATFGIYGILGGIGSQLLNRIDTFMVGTFEGGAATAIFTTAAFIALVIEVPQRSIEKISMPVIADSWKNNDVKALLDLYRKTALNQLIFGIWVFLGIWMSIDELFEIMAKTEVYSQGKTVILLLGIAKIIDMGTGVNNQIISLSRYYKTLFYIMISVSLLNILLNVILVQQMGFNGVAAATLITMTLYNMCKYLFLKFKLDMEPFDWKNIRVLLFGLATFGIVSMLPLYFHPIINILVKSILVTIFFLGPVLYFRVSSDINDLLEKGLEVIRMKLK